MSTFNSTDPLSDVSWKLEGKCYDLPLSSSSDDHIIYDSFFADSPVDRKKAQEFCEGCPVQQRCLKFAMETPQLFGVWGGRDESEIRRDLWMNSNGTVGDRAREPRCPWCKSREGSLELSNSSTNEIVCNGCGFHWKAESTAQALNDKTPTVESS